MAEYKVKVRSVVYYETIIEANSEDEAWENAEWMDGGEFTELPDSIWLIEDVREVIQ